MEMEDMIAKNRKEYVDITTKLLNDKEFYDKQVNLLKKGVTFSLKTKKLLKNGKNLCLSNLSKN